jgi:quercetin dioxygenase-like cupin family protein
MRKTLAPLSVFALALAVSACSTHAEVPNDDSNIGVSQLATQGSGSTSTLLSRGNFDGPIKLKRKQKVPSKWELKLEADPSLSVAVQTIDFAPQGNSGWHSHPGPVFITVLSGTMTFYRGDDCSCTPIVKTAGESLLDGADGVPHIARNETDQPATNAVVYFAPQGEPLRIDQPAPGNCPF